MNALSCKVFVRRTNGHLAQIYTGFDMLARQGVISLSQCFQMGPPNPLEVHLSTGKIIFFDVADADGFDSEDALDRADHYFKRSFQIDTIPARYRHKVHSLGLNYAVHPDGLPFSRIERLLRREPFTRAITHAAIALSSTQWLPVPRRFGSSVSELQGSPLMDGSRRVLFLARAWDPDAPEVRDYPEQQEERFVLNEMRANCIRSLRDTLGPDFLGGLAATPFAQRNYGDVVVTDALMTKRSSFVRMVQRHAICVATAGLHRSNGWKLAEYVAMSRAIVSERLHYEVPGGFTSPKNYLEFDSPDSCVASVVRLREEQDAREAMMLANQQYYDQWLRPDILVRRALHISTGTD